MHDDRTVRDPLDPQPWEEWTFILGVGAVVIAGAVVLVAIVVKAL